MLPLLPTATISYIQERNRHKHSETDRGVEGGGAEAHTAELGACQKNKRKRKKKLSPRLQEGLASVHPRCHTDRDKTYTRVSTISHTLSPYVWRASFGRSRTERRSAWQREPPMWTLYSLQLAGRGTKTCRHHNPRKERGGARANTSVVSKKNTPSSKFNHRGW